ncbi:hypothetical protein [Paenibacillus hexagrammi]|uniref:Uncharacterized protein n=1 Tax=Paenibacillus hexagrammi TaxID=2908839 RepID=A0ABY3SEQ6_9BACL|nr:hypothetical protein [Paenibacillus sp. YPD9-1]UJF31555.1 hypothetical protein L0M14_17260 [Paenibacillus sp. YPD9-1]
MEINEVKEGVLCWIIFNENQISFDNTLKWMNDFRFFTPSKVKYRGKKKATVKFSEKNLHEGIKQTITYKDHYLLEIMDSNNSLKLHRGSRALLTLNLDIETFDKSANKIMDTVNKFFLGHEGFVGIVCSSKDNFIQNISDPAWMRLYGLPVNESALISDPMVTSRIIYDIENNPGHSHHLHGLWFGSCWAMWYGNQYFDFVSKAALLAFNNCSENIELSEDAIRIILHDNIWDYNLPQNRDKQWAFRKAASIDEVAERLKNTPYYSNNSNPSIEINTGSFDHGGVRQIIYYLDENGKNVSKAIAKRYRISELDKDGVTLWEKEVPVQ